MNEKARRLWPAAAGIALLLAGGVLGWTIAPRSPAPLPLCVDPVLEDLTEAERRTAATAEILNDMAAGRISAGASDLETLRDSMQEIAGQLGDVRTQLESLVRQPRVPCPPSR